MKTYTANEMRVRANYLEGALADAKTAAMLRQAADMMEREDREKKYEYSVVLSGFVSHMHDEDYPSRGGKIMDYSNVRAVCFDCARKAGFVQKKKAVIAFEDECDICKARRPCTDLHHDWIPPKKKTR